MTTAQLLEIGKEVSAVWGAIVALCTTVALILPKGSKIGYWLAKIGSDGKGHTSPTLVDEEPQPPKVSEE